MDGERRSKWLKAITVVATDLAESFRAGLSPGLDHATRVADPYLKEGAGLEHVPSGSFPANGAWLCCAVLAHNLIRWTTTVGQPGPATTLTVARTVRTRLISVPARLVNLAGTPTLRCPRRWPWAQLFTDTLTRLRALETAPG